MAKEINKKKRKSDSKPKRKLLGKVQNAASDFLSSEEGKILKKDIVRTAVTLGLVAMAAGSVEAQHNDVTTHVNSHSDAAHGDAAHADSIVHQLHNDGANSGHSSGGHADANHADYPHNSSHTNATPHDNSHSNHANHANHANHGNHSAGGWC